MYLTKKAIHNLDKVLQTTGYNDGYLFDLQVMKVSERSFVILGPANEYGKVPKLILTDADEWILDV